MMMIKDLYTYRFLITASKDMTARIYTVDKDLEDFVPSTLSGHRDYIINAWFSADMSNVRRKTMNYIFWLTMAIDIYC